MCCSGCVPRAVFGRRRHVAPPPKAEYISTFSCSATRTDVSEMKAPALLLRKEATYTFPSGPGEGMPLGQNDDRFRGQSRKPGHCAVVSRKWVSLEWAGFYHGGPAGAPGCATVGLGQRLPVDSKCLLRCGRRRKARCGPILPRQRLPVGRGYDYRCGGWWVSDGAPVVGEKQAPLPEG